ncbi:MAG: arylsulfatase [Lentisphaeraceae bacterium]|nr:arylsulfatase [Lentisphaeraceae bacterium]
MLRSLKAVLIGLFALIALPLLAEKKPNVIIIYGDDVGLGDVGAYGAKLIPTPNIDKLASEGLMFMDGHCTAATCTPSRFSLLTGVHGFRHGVRILAPNAPLAIPTDIMTLPKMFKKAGYDTAVVGKWHLGIGDGKSPVDWNSEVKPGPIEVGFGYSFLLPSTNDRVPCVYLENYKVVGLDSSDPLYVGKKPADATSTVYPDGKKDRSAMTYYQSTHGHNNSVINGIGRIGYMWGGKSVLWNDETMADVFVEQTRKFISSKKDSDKPFFLYFASQDIHVPRTPHPRFKGKSELGYRGDAMVQFDWSTGQIMQILEENGMTENTIVIFSSDNGPVYDDGYDDGTTVKTSSKEVDRGHDGSGPYRGGKYQIYEGGTRVPFIVRWPAKIKAGTKSSALFNQIDLVASFASYLDVPLSANEAIDSRNMWKTFTGESSEGLPYMIEEARGLALRKGDWKYIDSSSFKKRNKKSKNTEQVKVTGQLFNLKNDIMEQNNIAKDNPELVKEMSELLIKLKSPEGIRNLK